MKLKIDEIRDSMASTLEALSAVVALHRFESGVGCSHCCYDYPCPTIQAIIKELK